MSRKKIDTEIISVEEISSSPVNPRKPTERSYGMVEQSMGEFGFVESILIDENNQLIHGNTRHGVAAEIGLKNVRVIDTDGDEVIAIRRKGLTEHQKLMLALQLNRSSELSGWDKETLVALRDDGLDLSRVFTSKEFNKLPDMAVPDVDEPMFDESVTDPDGDKKSDVVRSIEFTADQWETVGSALDKYRASTETLLSDSDIIAAICAAHLSSN